MRTRTLVTGAMAVLSAVALLTAQTGEDLLRQCRTKDRVDSDIPAAIKLCERVVSEFAANRQLLADARLELGRLYEGRDDAKAKQHYETVAAMSDQPAKAAEATTRLKALSKDPYPRIEIPTPTTDDVFSFALSPDGLSVVYQATIDGKSQLWLWRDGKTKPIPGTENARQWALPFWSPDGRNIGFFAEQKLKTVPIEGGSATVVADVGFSPRGGTWNTAGVIVFAELLGPLYRVPADGSDPPVVALSTNSNQNHYPRFLPDGRRFIFWRVNGAALQTSVGVIELR